MYLVSLVQRQLLSGFRVLGVGGAWVQLPVFVQRNDDDMLLTSQPPKQVEGNTSKCASGFRARCSTTCTMNSPQCVQCVLPSAVPEDSSCSEKFRKFHFYQDAKLL